MYSVYLDSILLNDPVGGIEDFTLTLERTFDSDNIFREFSESTLTFTGDGFNYLCSKLKEDYCSKVAIQVDIYGQTIFEGDIIVSFGTVNYTKRTFETQIVDTSYRGLIRERTKNEIPLNNVLTIDCEPIAAIPIIELPMANVNDVFVRNVKAFNVKDVIEYLISSMSNNTVAFQSTYLSTIPVALCTGFSLSGTDSIFTFRQYPTVSFEKLYSSLRSLLQLYASIEIIGGVPTIVMEQESYFFNNSSSGIIINEIPYDTLISVDEDRIYSVVEIGSEEYDEESPNNAFPNNKVEGWGSTVLNTCGCVFDRDNIKDIRPDFIIDSGKIIDTIVNADGKEELYLIQLNPLLPTTPLKVFNGSKMYYNSSFRNEIVALNWSVQFNNCVYLPNVLASQFFAFDENRIGTTPDCNFQAFDASCLTTDYLVQMYMRYFNVQSDGYDGLITISGNLSCAAVVACSNNHTGYEVQVPGNYAFSASRLITVTYPTVIGSTITFGIAITIEVWQDTSFAVLLNSWTTADTVIATSVSNPTTFTRTPIIDTPLISLQTGNVIRVLFSLSAEKIGGSPVNTIGVFGDGYFKTNDELMGCISIQPEGNRIPYLMKFEQTMCKDDYDLINENRRNYIDIAGYKGWVKRLEYNPKGIGTFELLTEEIPCCDE